MISTWRGEAVTFIVTRRFILQKNFKSNQIACILRLFKAKKKHVGAVLLTAFPILKLQTKLITKCHLSFIDPIDYSKQKVHFYAGPASDILITFKIIQDMEVKTK